MPRIFLLMTTLIFFLSAFAFSQSGKLEEEKIQTLSQIQDLRNELQTVQDNLKLVQDPEETAKLQKQIADLTSQYDKLSQIENRTTQQENQLEEFNDNIATLKLTLSEREKSITALNQKFTDLSKTVESILTFRVKTEEEKEAAKKLSEEIITAKTAAVNTELTNFKSYIFSWNDLGATIDAISSTAEGILIFPENNSSESTLMTVLKYVGIAGGLAGTAYVKEDAENGTIIAAGFLTATALLQTIFTGGVASEIVQNISRNVAFQDEIRAFTKLSAPFATKAKALNEEILQNSNLSGWFPSEKNLIDYYSLIALRRDLAVVLRQMRAKAEYLLQTQNNTLTEDGETTLKDLKSKYDRALSAWEASEAKYLSTYTFLANELRTKK